MIEEILERLKQIETRLDSLERRDTNPFPLIGPKSYDWNKKTCPVCRLDLSNAMGYVCNNSACPVYPKVTC
jgi:hypothetical protein